MINILSDLCDYLGHKLNMTPGINVFYNSMPDEPNECILIESPRHGIPVPAQIDASAHPLRITVRATTSNEAFELAAKCYRWLRTDSEVYAVDEYEATGFITLLSDLTVFIQLHGTPLWDKTDQQGRRYYYFTATLITKRTI